MSASNLKARALAVAGLILVLSPLASAQAAVLTAHDRSMMSEVDMAMRAEGPEDKKFEILEHAALEFRTGRVTYENGGWKLTNFYNALGTLMGMGRQSFQVHWQQKYPDSPVPKLLTAQAQVYGAMGPLNQALIMGGSAQNWSVRPEDVKAAHDTLQALRPLADADPYWYVLMARLALISERNDSAFTTMMLEAVRKFPSYDDLYAASADYFLPKWGGSAKQLETWARTVAAETGALPQSHAYARTYLHAMQVQYGSALFRESRVDWTELKRDASGLLLSFPAAKNVARLTMAACVAGDHQEAARLVALNPTSSYLGEYLNGDDRKSCEQWAKTPWWVLKFNKFMAQAGSIVDRIAGVIDGVLATAERIWLATLDRLTRPTSQTTVQPAP